MMQQMYSVGMPQDRTVLKTNRTSVNFCRTLLRSGSNPQACADLLPRNQPFRLPNIRLDWQQRRTLLRMEPDLNITFRANQQSGMLMGSGCGSHSPHQMTLATASPLGVLFAPTNMVMNVDMVAA